MNTIYLPTRVLQFLGIAILNFSSNMFVISKYFFTGLHLIGKMVKDFETGKSYF